MRRGEVFVSVQHSGIGRCDPVLLAVIFGIACLIFLNITIVVPTVLSENAGVSLCGPAESLNRNEQQICTTSSKGKFISKVDAKGAKLVKNYRIAKADLGATKHRFATHDVEANLKDGALVFPMTSSYALTFVMNVTCTGDKCDTVRMWWLTNEYYKAATKKKSFDEEMYGWKDRNFRENKYVNEGLDGSKTYYLVFSNSKQDALMSYTINFDYTVYDMSKSKVYSFNSDNECVFDDLETNEAIIMDYADPEGTGPTMIDATIGADQTNNGLIAFLAIFFTLLTLGCFAICLLLILHIYGKLGSFDQKISMFIGQNSTKYNAPEMAAIEVTREVVEEY